MAAVGENRRALSYKAVAAEIARLAREEKPLVLPLNVNGREVDERTVIDAVVRYWIEIAAAKGINVHAAPVAVETFEWQGTLHVIVHLPYNYKLKIRLENGVEPTVLFEAPEYGCECNCGEERR